MMHVTAVSGMSIKINFLQATHNIALFRRSATWGVMCELRTVWPAVHVSFSKISPLSLITVELVCANYDFALCFLMNEVA